jgi:hypothetical protein
MVNESMFLKTNTCYVHFNFLIFDFFLVSILIP